MSKDIEKLAKYVFFIPFLCALLANSFQVLSLLQRYLFIWCVFEFGYLLNIKKKEKPIFSTLIHR